MINLNNAGVRIARKSNPLNGSPILFKKTNNHVILHGHEADSMYCLTASPAQYDYITKAPQDNPHIPRLFQDHGIVGHHTNGFPLYLLEIERLIKHEFGSRMDRGVIAKAISFAGKCLKKGENPFLANRPANLELTDELVKLGIHVQDVVGIDPQEYHLYPQFTHLCLTRESDNALVLMDPVYDRKTNMEFLINP